MSADRCAGVRFEDEAVQSPDESGGFNGSMQHLLKIFLYASWRVNSFAGTDANKTKALLRF
jgi:hypothetical protein